MKKKKRRIAGLFALFVCIFAMVLPAKASDPSEYDYYFKQYSVNAKVHKNATMTVKENLHVYFNESRHGIYRDIPRIVKIKRKVSGRVKTYTYQVRVKVESVDGAPYKVKTEYGYYNIIIGDEDETVFGDANYIITYTYDFGDDQISGSDEFYYSLIGTGWQVPIESADFHVSFDKKAEVSGAHVYVGEVDGNDESRAKVSMKSSQVTGIIKNQLEPGEAVTMYVPLPRNYYENARKTPINLYWILIGLAGLLFVFVLVRKMRNKVKKTVKTVEFYPPEGMSSAEVGYIIDESADDKDIISLVFWLAHQGYLSISGEDQNLQVTKSEKSTDHLPEYAKVFYDGLFDRKDSCYLSELDYQFEDTMTGTKGALEACFWGERKLAKEEIRRGSYFWMFVASLLSAALVFVIGGMSFNMVNLILSGAMVVYWTALGIMTEKRFPCIALSVIALIFAGIILISGSIYAVSYMTVAILMPLPSMIVLARTSAATDYRIDMMGRLLGLKEFIKKAELDKLNRLVEENPAYFYDVLPYAYVFGLTDKWAKKFEHIAIKQPDWYVGSGHPFTTYYMVHSISHGMTRSVETVHASALSQKTSTSGTSGGFGGGGFSGGGFGGGGGGSW